MEQWFEQVWYCAPQSSAPRQPGLILSAGIHGDETRPVVLLRQLQQQLASGQLQPARPLLLLYGNPRAMARHQRMITENLNRLFTSPSSASADGQRARVLMDACERLGRLGPVAAHFDLHSTIKPSLIERFPLCPVSPVSPESPPPCHYHWAAPLSRAGFGAWVQQTRRAATFSQFTRDALNCDSFTLECGSHASKPDRENRLQPLARWLHDLISGAAALPAQPMPVTPPWQRFRVTEEILRRSDDFQFLIDEQEPNFSAHPPGTPLYRDLDGVVKAAGQRHTLFLNSQVAPGQRAGLLLESLQ